MSNSTATAVEVIPTLTAENFRAVREGMRRPAPSGILDPGSEDRLYRVELTEIVTEDGKPTVWIVDAEDNEMFLFSSIPCSVPSCAGHGSVEIDDKWNELMHRIAERSLPPFKSGQVDKGELEAILFSRDGKRVVNYLVNIEGELPVNQLANLADWFDDTANAIREVAADWIE